MKAISDEMTLTAIRQRAKGTQSERDVEILIKVLEYSECGCPPDKYNCDVTDDNACMDCMLAWAAAEVTKKGGGRKVNDADLCEKLLIKTMMKGKPMSEDKGKCPKCGSQLDFVHTNVFESKCNEYHCGTTEWLSSGELNESSMCRKNQIEQLSARVKELEAALRHDQTGLADALSKCKAAAENRKWIVEGRGSYTWDDDEYRREAGYALDEITALCGTALNESWNKASEAIWPDLKISNQARIKELESKVSELEPLAKLVKVEPVPAEDGGGFMASIPALGEHTFRADGDTPEEAVNHLKSVTQMLVDDWHKDAEVGRLVGEMPEGWSLEHNEEWWLLFEYRANGTNCHGSSKTLLEALKTAGLEVDSGK